jgi:hypothetical protein
LHDPSEHPVLLLASPSGPDITANPNLIRRRRSVAEVATARCDVLEDYKDKIAGRTGLLMMDRGDTVDDFRFLGWRQPSSSGGANVGRHLILLSG